jgi:hypothetical protein
MDLGTNLSLRKTPKSSQFIQHTRNMFRQCQLDQGEKKLYFQRIVNLSTNKEDVFKDKDKLQILTETSLPSTCNILYKAQTIKMMIHSQSHRIKKMVCPHRQQHHVFNNTIQEAKHNISSTCCVLQPNFLF